ncbi:uncharacterized protein [Montipora capricornis]|uniref:uncharacterized protein isoform X2 n=1 Tax=Montipora capricornis TaxID=246305 RepID=UPI0035F16E34
MAQLVSEEAKTKPQSAGTESSSTMLESKRVEMNSDGSCAKKNDMKFYVYYKCENDGVCGQTKLSFSEFDNKCIGDVKTRIQDALQAPICDQKLFYQGKLLTDDSMQLDRLYFREGDHFVVQFLAAADIPGICELCNELREAAHEILEDLHGKLPLKVHEVTSKLLPLSERLFDAVHDLSTFFFPWKNLESVAQRHYFVQEGGFDAFLEVFKFSRHLYSLNHPIDVFAVGEELTEEIRRHEFNQHQLVLQMCCLTFLWNFAETPEDRKFVLSKGVLPLAIEALLLHQQLIGDHDNDFYGGNLYVRVNEKAIGCCAGLVESDSSTQEEVSRMIPLIDKILFMIDRRQSGLQDYSLFSSQVASNSLFYCTFNVNSAQSLVNIGALTKMLDITRHFLLDKDGDVPLRYYCCLFLARMHSAPLIKLDRDTCGIIDELINMFLEEHLPSEISAWENESSYVWMTMVPLFHLAFAGGIESHFARKVNDGYYNHGLVCKPLLNTSKCIVERNRLANLGPYQQVAQAMISPQLSAGWDTCSEASSALAPLESSCCVVKESTCQSITCGEMVEDMLKSKGGKSRQITEVSNMMSDNVSVKGQSCLSASPGKIFTWPGSKSTQELGIFSLVHMLSIKDNQKLALAENLVEYLVCLSWQLSSDNTKYIRWSLSNFQLVSPPSLKVIAKSVLACVNGLDMVYHH